MQDVASTIWAIASAMWPVIASAWAVTAAVWAVTVAVRAVTTDVRAFTVDVWAVHFFIVYGLIRNAHSAPRKYFNNLYVHYSMVCTISSNKWASLFFKSCPGRLERACGMCGLL